jgi:SAM-dependent methyltransferase
MAMIEPRLYELRFSDDELTQARRMWEPIARFLQRYVSPGGTTVDLGAGYCHFINAIQSHKKIAVDLNAAQFQRYAADGVQYVHTNATDLSAIGSDSVDTVFASNIYEHFHTREDVAKSFLEVWRILKPNGRFIILQPNFACCYRAYFDFFDHRLAFTHLGMAEGLSAANFTVTTAIRQFLPYTTKSRLPKSPWLVQLYLSIPLAWRILGGQMLLVAEKRNSR